MNSGHMEIDRDQSVYAEERANVNRTHIEVTDRAISVISLILASIAITTALWINRENDQLYRHVQELRIRVEDAELAAREVNPHFNPVRQPKDK